MILQPPFGHFAEGWQILRDVSNALSSENVMKHVQSKCYFFVLNKRKAHENEKLRLANSKDRGDWRTSSTASAIRTPCRGKIIYKHDPLVECSASAMVARKTSNLEAAGSSPARNAHKL